MRKILISLTLLIGIFGFSFYGYVEGIHVKRQTIQQLETMLAPHYETFLPQGKPPFATVVGYHGCSGTLHGARDWAKLLNQEGYAVVLVESIKPRNLDWPEVCAGKKLWGSERAGDVMVSLDAIKNMPFVDPAQLHLMGWSHGGWALLDTLSYAANNKRPPNLSASPNNPLSGVKSTTLFYPFCNFPVRARNGWSQTFPVHFVFAETDSIVSNQACQDIINAQVASDLPVTSETYADTDHAFDMRDEDFYDGTLTGQPDATRAVHADILAKLNQWSR